MSPGPLHSPGSSSDSNGVDAEGPGPPAPVSNELPQHLSHCPFYFELSLPVPHAIPPRLPGRLTDTWAPGTGHPNAAQCSAVPQVTFQQICKDVHLVKHQGQQLFIESRAKPTPRPRLLGE